MRYRFVRRLVLFLIFLSVVVILSISKWSAKDNEPSIYGSVKEIQFGRSYAGNNKRIKHVYASGTASSDSLITDQDSLLLLEPASASSSAAIVTSRIQSPLQRRDSPGKDVDSGGQGFDGSSESAASSSSGAKFARNPKKAFRTKTTVSTYEETHRRQRLKRKVNGTYTGFVNVHIWEEWCGYRILDLRRNKHFPLYPDIRQIATRLYLRHGEAQFGQRIFGYLKPPGTGHYVFAISSDDSAEVWLSVSNDPELVRRIAAVEDPEKIANTFLGQFNKYKGQISTPIALVKDKQYFFEILHKQHAYRDHVLVAWKGPKVPVFKVISSRYLSAYFSEDDISNDVTDLAEFIPETTASYANHLHSYESKPLTLNQPQSSYKSADSRDDVHKVPFVDRKYVDGIFSKCPYHPSYLVDFKVKRYEGVTLIHETAVYPDDSTQLTHMYSECETRERDSHGNDLNGDRESGTLEPPEKTTPRSNVFFKISAFLSGVKSGIQSYISMALPTRALPVVDHKEGILNVSDSSQYYPSTSKSNASVPDTAFKPAKLVKKRSSGKILATKSSLEVTFRYPGAPGELNKSPKLRARRTAKRAALKFDTLKFLRQRFRRNPLVGQNTVGRKLLSLIPFRPPQSYDVDDEGLPNSYGSRKLSRPIFVPIRGVENDTYSFRAFSSLPRHSNHMGGAPAASSKDFYEEDSPKGDNRTENKIYINPEVFKLKSAREVMSYYRIFKSSIYHMMKELPRPDTWKFRQYRSECKNDGNLRLNEKVANSVANKVLKRLQEKNNGEFILKKVVNVEENHDVINGDRYLVELDLQIKGRGDQSFRFSRYLYQPVGSLELCEPEGLQWDPHSTVHVIIPVKNQGRWVQHFINNMEKIYMETLDNHLNIIIVDFNSSDIDIDRCLKKSKLPRYRVVHLDGPFQRALGIQAGADLVENPHDIIFTCDLHLEIPVHLIDSIRKHCIEGKMAFAPVVVRLECGYTPDMPYGLWEIQGYGLFAVCKSDFDRVGGMNTKEFKTKWGGEDWEMLDRVLSHGIEVERLRIPKFYHYHHSKKRMWVARNDDDELRQ